MNSFGPRKKAQNWRKRPFTSTTHVSKPAKTAEIGKFSTKSDLGKRSRIFSKIQKRNDEKNDVLIARDLAKIVRRIETKNAREKRLRAKTQNSKLPAKTFKRVRPKTLKLDQPENVLKISAGNQRITAQTTPSKRGEIAPKSCQNRHDAPKPQNLEFSTLSKCEENMEK